MTNLQNNETSTAEAKRKLWRGLWLACLLQVIAVALIALTNLAIPM